MLGNHLCYIFKINPEYNSYHSHGCYLVQVAIISHMHGSLQGSPDWSCFYPLLLSIYYQSSNQSSPFTLLRQFMTFFCFILSSDFPVFYTVKTKACRITYKAIPDLSALPSGHLILCPTVLPLAYSVPATLGSLLFLECVRSHLYTLASFAWNALPTDIHSLL